MLSISCIACVDLIDLPVSHYLGPGLRLVTANTFAARARYLSIAFLIVALLSWLYLQPGLPHSIVVEVSNVGKSTCTRAMDSPTLLSPDHNIYHDLK